MGLKPRKPADSRSVAHLTKALEAYHAARSRGNEVWELWETQPNAPASAEDISKLETKFERALPKDYRQFLQRHDGWEGYEYDRHLLSAKEILEGAADFSMECNMENVSEDEADTLDKMFVIAICNGDASVVYFDPTATGEPPLVEYYCEEQARYASFTEFIESLTKDLNSSVDAEQGTQEAANADWDPDVRRDKSQAYQAELAARLKIAPAKTFSGLTDVERAAIAQCAKAAAKQPKLAAELKRDKLQVHLGLVAYMLYVPTAEEVTTAALLFRKHFPWHKRTLACAPSDEYGRKPIPADTTDYSEFLILQTGGHFGLRMVDDNSRKATTHIFNFRGSPKYHGEAVASFLEILLPADADTAALRDLMLDLADALPLAHGFAGYMTLPTNENYTRHMELFYDWCRAHWGVQVALADEMVAAALHGLHAVSWLTLIDNDTIETLCETNRALPTDGIDVHKRSFGTVIQAGDAPILGDVRNAYPDKYAAVHRALAPLFSPGIAELRHFDDHGATQAWWHRFERPNVFAESPVQLLARIKTAADKGDTATMRSVWKQLEDREPAARTALQEQLAKLAWSLLNEKKLPIAYVYYDWLTQFERPGLYDLNNSLLSVWDEPELAPTMIERALPKAEANPHIFHNIVALYTHQGQLDKAVEVARRAEPHYEIKLFLLLKSDKDFAPLFERADYVEIYNKMQARLAPSSDWTPLARNEALEAKVGAHPDDEAVYREYGDWLIGRDDPRGPLIAAHIDTREQPRSKPYRQTFKNLFKTYVKNRLASRYPSLAAYFRPDSSPPWGFEYRWGVVYSVGINGLPKDCRDEAMRFLQDPECRLMRSLYLKNQSWDLQCLESVPYLTTLSLQKAKFASLDPVTKLSQLEELVLSSTAISEVSLLANMTSLKRLYLKSTKVVDLSPLRDLPNLEFINLEATKVTDLKPLHELPRLNQVWLYKTSIAKADAEKLERVINSRRDGVSVYGP